MHHHACLIFVFLVEMGFHHVGQAGLKLLDSSDPPASASQNTGITSKSHHSQSLLFLKQSHLPQTRLKTSLQLIKEKSSGQVWWLTPVIPALWEAKVGRSLGQEIEIILANPVKPRLY